MFGDYSSCLDFESLKKAARNAVWTITTDEESILKKDALSFIYCNRTSGIVS